MFADSPFPVYRADDAYRDEFDEETLAQDASNKEMLSDGDGSEGVEYEDADGSDAEGALALEADGDEDSDEASEGEELESGDAQELADEEEDELEALGLPKKGTVLSARQKKKMIAEAERLEELLRRSGHDLGEEEGEDDGQGLDEQQMAFLDDGEDGDEMDEDEEDEEEGEEGEGVGDDFMLPTVEERENERVIGPDLQVVQMRIQEVVAILGSFKKLATDGR